MWGKVVRCGEKYLSLPGDKLSKKPMRFLGTIEAKIDSKGRAFLPAQFRKELQGGGEAGLVMRKDIFQPCLVLYPESVWERQTDALRSRLNRWNPMHQNVFRQFVADAETVTLDGLGSFRLVMNSGGRGVESAEEVSASQARLTVRFTPASTRHADRTLATRSMVTGAKFARYEAPLADDSGTAAPEPGEDEEGSGEAPDPIV